MVLCKEIINEVWQSVFKLLPKSSIYQCMHVCKLWFRLAAEIYYKEVILTGNAAQKLKSRLLNNDKKRHDELFAPGLMVQKLRIRATIRVIDELLPFIFGELFLNLKYINFSASKKHYRTYASFLCDSPSCDNLAAVQEITPPLDSRQRHPNSTSNRLHFSACYRFRHTLTHLSIGNLQNAQVDPIDLVKSLPEFKNLTYLSIVNCKDSSNNALSLLLIPFSCHTLISFELKCEVRLADIHSPLQLYIRDKDDSMMASEMLS